MKKEIGFRLLLITDRKLLNGKSLESTIRAASKAGVKAVQLREKDLESGELLKLAKKIQTITNKYGTRLVINDRTDIAVLANAGMVHLTANSIPVQSVRKLSRNILIGKSVHSLKEAVKAEHDECSYILFGPVFRTPAKVKFGKPQGLEMLRKICTSVNIPVFAVGGVTPGRVKKCMDAGALGVAAIRPFMKTVDMKKTVSEYKKELGNL